MWKRERTGLAFKKVGCVTAAIIWSDTEEGWNLYAKLGKTSDLEELGTLEGFKKRRFEERRRIR